MDKQPRVINSSRVKISKRFGGGLCFEYQCPKCGEHLKSFDSEVLLGDNCPTCHRSFVFSGGVQNAWKKFASRQQRTSTKESSVPRERSRYNKHSEVNSANVFANTSSQSSAETISSGVGVKLRATQPNVLGDPISLSDSWKSCSSVVDIFDWKIRTYITPWILRFTWVGSVICGLLISLILIFSAIGVWLPADTTEAPAKLTLKQIQEKVAARAAEEPRQPVLSPFFIIKTVKTCWSLIYLILVALAVLWIRVLLETGIILFDIAKTVTAIHGSLREKSMNHPLPVTAEAG